MPATGKQYSENVILNRVANDDVDAFEVDIANSIPAGTNNIGDVDVASIAAGTNLIGKVGLDQTTNGTTNGVSTVSKKILVAQATYNEVLNVAAGANTTVVVTPTAGELWRVKLMYISLAAPAGSASGTHFLTLRPYNNSVGCEVLRMTSNYNVVVSLYRNLIETATTPLPTNAAEQMRAVQEIVMTAAAPLSIYYQNDTNVSQTGTLLIRIAREVEYIV